jgi:hypothetical protein
MEETMNIFPKVLQVVPADDYKVYAYLNDGSVRLFDATSLIAKGGVFAPLADMQVFRSAATVMNGTIAWDISGKRDEYSCIDIDPFTVAEAPIVVDPLQNVS